MPVAITHPERVVYPASGHTKGDVVQHYERVAARMLPHVAGRPLTLRRFPRGVGAPGFFQKNVPAFYPASIARVEVARHEGKTLYPSVSEPEHLVFLANQNVIELHVPTITSADEWHPDRFVIDLDPPEGALPRVRQAARIVREALEAWGLATVPVATGSKGYHVVGALDARVSSDRAALAAQQAAALLEKAHPELLTTAFRVKERGGKIFLDWLRNMPFATVVAPLSLRARPRPTMACVLEWSEIDRVAPDGVEMDGAAERLARPDPLVALDTRPSHAERFVAAVEEAFLSSGLELATFDRFRS